MNSVFVRVNTLPKVVSKHEMTLSKPTFVDEVKACFKRKGSSAKLGPNYLRAIAEEIGRRYDKNFNPYRHVVPQDFAGRMSGTDEDTAKTVSEMFTARYPLIYQKYYESVLRSRPFNIKVIYVTDDVDTSLLKKLGIYEISVDQIDAHLGGAREQDEIIENNVQKIEQAPTETLAKIVEETPAETLAKITAETPAETPAPEIQAVKVEENKQNLQVKLENKNRLNNKNNNNQKTIHNKKPTDTASKEPNV